MLSELPRHSPGFYGRSHEQHIRVRGTRRRGGELEHHFESLRRKSRRRLEEVAPAEFAFAGSQARSVAHVARILGVADTTAFRRGYRERVIEQTLNVSHILSDNRPENLRFLCPNCHAATPTFCRKKRG